MQRQRERLGVVAATGEPNAELGVANRREDAVAFVAEDVREIMAQLGFRTIDEMIGHISLFTKPCLLAAQ